MRPLRRPGPHWLVTGVAVVTILGPALGNGTVLAYDLAWPRSGSLTTLAQGLAGPAPRAVPSDAVATVVSWLLSPDLAEKVTLAGILVLAASGAVALQRRWWGGSLGAAAATALLAVWNPFVFERLALGQWTILLGYAVLPWALRAVVRLRSGEGSVTAVAGWVLLAGLGGANAWLLVAPPVLLLTLWIRPLWRWLLLAASASGVAAVWALPALVAGVRGDPQGFAVFAAHPDSPLGLVGSLLGGGGIWNPAAVPPERASGVLATVQAAVLLAGAVAVARTRAAPLRVGVIAIALAGVGLSAMSGTSWLAGPWEVLTSLLGGDLVRDSQKLVALWTIVGVVGVGGLVQVLARRGGGAALLAAVIALVGALSLPSMAWGLQGRLTAHPVPSDFARLQDALAGQPAGEVGLLPWAQYRRYAWNGSRVSLSVIPRLVRNPVLHDDSLVLRSARIEGESPRARTISAEVGRGSTPAAALSAAGVRYLVVEKETGLPVDTVEEPGAQVLLDTPTVALYALPGSTAYAGSRNGAVLLGWLITAIAVAGLGISAFRHRRGIH